MVELIEEQKASSINKSRYVLFELPMNSKTMDVKEVIYKLMEKGYVPIIAHPERYLYVQGDIDRSLFHPSRQISSPRWRASLAAFLFLSKAWV